MTPDRQVVPGKSRAVTDLPPDLPSIPAASARMGVSATTGYELAPNGSFPGAVKIGAKWRVSVVKLGAFLHPGVERSPAPPAVRSVEAVLGAGGLRRRVAEPGTRTAGCGLLSRCSWAHTRTRRIGAATRGTTDREDGMIYEAHTGAPSSKWKGIADALARHRAEEEAARSPAQREMKALISHIKADIGDIEKLLSREGMSERQPSPKSLARLKQIADLVGQAKVCAGTRIK
jgi:hypothetical protein